MYTKRVLSLYKENQLSSRHKFKSKTAWKELVSLHSIYSFSFIHFNLIIWKTYQGKDKRRIKVRHKKKKNKRRKVCIVLSFKTAILCFYERIAYIYSLFSGRWMWRNGYSLLYIIIHHLAFLSLQLLYLSCNPTFPYTYTHTYRIIT